MRSFIILYFLLACADLFSQENNVLLIIADDLGVDPVSGYMPEALEKANTPVLDSLRESGITFTKVWTNPICSPTRSSIITGKYGFRTGVLNAEDLAELEPTELILHRHLTEESDGDVNSSIFGKWHLGGNANSDYPLEMGVPYYAGIMLGGVPSYSNWTYTENGTGEASTEYVTTKLTDEAIDWINLQDNPWLCWVAYNAPHTPFHIPPSELHTTEGLVNDELEIETNPLPYYMAMIESLDTEIGRLISEMPEEILENTTIIFIGDNGSPGQVAQDPYTSNRAKGSLFQGGVHVPLIMSGNQVLRQNETDSSLITSTDLFCTITELMGFELNEYENSYSMLDMLSQENAGQRDCSFTDIKNDQKGYGWAARDDRYKYVVWDSVPERFYDLWEDPFEQSSLFNGKGNMNEEELEALEKLSGVRETLSVKEEAPSSYALFPNPTSSKFIVNDVQNSSLVQIFDFSGRLLMSSKTGVYIDVSLLNSGVYLVQVGDITRRLVKY
ncbi:MAG: sulfatase-like hydrolase/transferase [Flavobacteriales bacterium]